MFDSDGVSRVLLVSSLGISCGEVCEEARGRQSSGGTGDGDSEGDLEQLRSVSSAIYMYQARIQLRKSRDYAKLTYNVNDDALHMI